MSQQIRQILQLLESGGLGPPDEPDSAGGAFKNTGGGGGRTAAPRKVSRASLLSGSYASAGSLFGEDMEEEGGESLDEYTVGQLSARRRSNLGRIVEERTRSLFLFILRFLYHFSLMLFRCKFIV